MIGVNSSPVAMNVISKTELNMRKTIPNLQGQTTASLPHWGWSTRLACVLLGILAVQPVIASDGKFIETKQGGESVRIEVLSEKFAQVQSQLGSNQARLVVYRAESASRLPGATSIFVNGMYHTSLIPGGFSQLCMAPGAVQIGTRQTRTGVVERNSLDSLSITEFKTGQTQFLRMEEEGSWAVMKKVTPEEARKDLSVLRNQVHTISRVVGAIPCEEQLTALVAPAIEPVVPAKPPVQKAEEPITLSMDALFAFNKSSVIDMSLEGIIAINQMVKRVHKEYSRIDSVRLVGHADPLGSADANQRISLARAEAVRDYLKNSDLIQATIQAEGRGDKEPLVKQCGKAITDASVQCNKPNRRVLIEVMGVKR